MTFVDVMHAVMGFDSFELDAVRDVIDELVPRRTEPLPPAKSLSQLRAEMRASRIKRLELALALLRSEAEHDTIRRRRSKERGA